MNNYLYKYLPLYDFKKFTTDSKYKEYTIENILKNQIRFSTRSEFNDLFDSKVDFIVPKKYELKRIYSNLRGSEKETFKRRYINVYDFGFDPWDKIKGIINSKLDLYLFLCLTDKNNSNLMWAHYANNHQGVCLEFDASKISARKVNYNESIASFELIDLIKEQFGLSDKATTSDKMWGALNIKLKEWEYESEYRFQAGNRMERHVIKKDGVSLISYDPTWVTGIIFGCRTDKGFISYLDERLPSHIERKHAVECRNSINIKRYPV